MPAIDFPNNPQNNQTLVVNNITYQYNSATNVWNFVPNPVDGYTGSQGDTGFTGSQGIPGEFAAVGFTGSTGATGFVGSTGSLGFTGSTGFTGSAGQFYSTGLPPESAVAGDLWFDTARGVLAIYVDDGDSQQWVEVSASGYQGPIGYTGSAGPAGNDGTSGASDFTALTDTPAGYTDQAGKIVLVNNTEDGLEFGELPAGISSIAVSNLYQAGDLIVFTGTQRWYAPYNLTFTEISARVVENANDDIEIAILKNGTLLTGLTIPVGLYIASTTGGGQALTMNEGEYITVDLIQVGTVVQPGSDLYLQFKYVNN
jgi:hypothetical protein